MFGTIKNKKFTNRGFSTGPFCLIYGISAVIMTMTLSELLENTVFLFIGCALQATIIEWVTGKTLEHFDRRKWWDYSGIKWNFDGYICLPYSLLWGLLGLATLKFGNTFFLFVYKFTPEVIRTALIWIITSLIILDFALSTAAVVHRRSRKQQNCYCNSRFIRHLYKTGTSVLRFVENRTAKAYPAMQERAEAIRKEGNFAEGCGFYKLFWLFLIGALLGDLTETIFCRVTAGVWMSRSSLVWGPFSIVWGFAIALATALLYKDKDKPDRHIFAIGTLLGGAYEYACSVFTEIVFGQVFWDYSHIPFNLGGRVNLLYCFFWGIAAVIWIKLLYPHFARLIEHIPKIPGYIATWILVVFMAANMLTSAAALIRYNERSGGAPAESGWQQFIDTHFDDETMQKIYPNSTSA